MTPLLWPLQDHVTKKPVVTGGVLALGNFDGVHVGHAAVIAVAAKEAKRRGIKTHVLTFEPHPYALFQAEPVPFLITSAKKKNELLYNAGADHVVTLPFTRDFAALSPEAFVEKILVETCKAQHVVVGFDFVFGSGRGGDREALRKQLEPHGIGVTEVAPIRDERGEIISSSRIRAALKKGDVALARGLLGRPFIIEGKVQQGDQRGRGMDYPTANIKLAEIVRPHYGAYVIKARAQSDEQWHEGIANIGIRPTIGGKQEFLEFHLFDFDRIIYGEKWEVALLHFLRAEQSFANLEALKQQIQQDEQRARHFLKTNLVQREL